MLVPCSSKLKPQGSSVERMESHEPLRSRGVWAPGMGRVRTLCVPPADWWQLVPGVVEATSLYCRLPVLARGAQSHFPHCPGFDLTFRLPVCNARRSQKAGIREQAHVGRWEPQSCNPAQPSFSLSPSLLSRSRYTSADQGNLLLVLSCASFYAQNPQLRAVQYLGGACFPSKVH